MLAYFLADTIFRVRGPSGMLKMKSLSFFLFALLTACSSSSEKLKYCNADRAKRYTNDIVINQKNGEYIFGDLEGKVSKCANYDGFCMEGDLNVFDPFAKKYPNVKFEYKIVESKDKNIKYFVSDGIDVRSLKKKSKYTFKFEKNSGLVGFSIETYPDDQFDGSVLNFNYIKC